jgi:hypothetical protein
MPTPAKTAFDAATKFIGNKDKQMINQMLNNLEFLGDVRTMRLASLNGTLLPKMTVAGGIRPLDLDVETRAGSNRNFTGRKLFVYEGMKIIDMIPEELYNTFLSDMLEPGAKQMPFAQWVWEQEFAKIAQEINDNLYLSTYKGDAALFNAGTAYAVGDHIKFGTENDIYRCTAITTAAQSPTTHPAKWTLVNTSVISTGWGTIIAAEITAGNIAGANLISTGAITSANALDKVEAMVNGMTVAHRKLGGQILVSDAVYSNYLKQEKTVYSAALNQQMGNGQKTVYGYPNWVIKRATWMGTSSRLIATQKNNFVFGTNVESNMNTVAKTIETLHGSRSVVKWLQGCEIADLETLYVNDQA